MPALNLTHAAVSILLSTRSNNSISSPSEAASVKSVGEEAGSSAVGTSLAVLESSPEDPAKGLGTNPRGEATSLGNGEPKSLPSDVKEPRSPQTITAIDSTLMDLPQNQPVSTRTEENPSTDTPAQERTAADQPDVSPSCLTNPHLQNHNANNIRSADDDATRSASVNATDCDENKDRCVDDPLQSSNAYTDDISNGSSGNRVPTPDEVDGVTPQATPTPSLDSAHTKPDKKKPLFQRNKKSSNEGNLLIYPIKLMFFSTAA